MSRTHILKLLLTLPVLCLIAAPLKAQTVKNISVSAGTSYTDHIALSEDSRDSDIMVKFVFDEDNNTLTVSALSYRTLFVFREASRYKAVVFHKNLIPDRLPYVADADKGSKFPLSKGLVKSIPSPKKKYIFNRWIEYEGLQPAPADYKMVNDYIEQTFQILGARNSVSVTLRDLLLLEPVKKSRWQLLQGRDLNARYQIRIQRNPCLGRDEEIAEAQANVETVKAAYENFNKIYASGTVPSMDALKTYKETKDVLLTQFTAKQGQSPCPLLQEATDQYNHYVDSIANHFCRIEAPEEPGEVKTLDIKMIYAQARQIDKSVARYLVSNDELERYDLVTQCNEIIKDISGILSRYPYVMSAEEENAVRVYRQAEQYFKKTCK